MGVALWWLAGRDVIKALALVAFLPVAVEFWFRNIHLFLAVLVVFGVRRSSPSLALGAAIKLSPGLGIPYLVLRGRWRPAVVATMAGLLMLGISVALSPDAWIGYLDLVRTFDPGAQSAFIDVPFPIRAALAIILTFLASRLDERRGNVLFVAAVTLALPSLWFTGLSLLVAAVPILRDGQRPDHGGRSLR
jgi:hypothetical protein